MRLKTLEISGFKSFPQKTTLHFSTPIAAIVGPNGSGKSNIAEAFRFVLGEQSMKSMRGKRGEDLIFNGSARHSRMNRGSVSVVLDNHDRSLDVDFDEVALERTVHRDGANEYRINTSPVRLKDIRELIAGAHIGSSGHHIISQGEADKIIEATPEERKEMIEDALGLRIYQSKRLESIKKLDSTRENIREVRVQRREVAPRIQQLKNQKEKIEATREMTRQLTSRACDYFAREAQQIEYAQNKARQELEPLAQEKTRLENELEKVQTTIKQGAEQSDNSRQLQEIDAAISDLQQRRDEITRDIGRLEGEIAAHERVIREADKTAEDNASRKVYLRHVEETAHYIEGQISQAESSGTVEKMQEAFNNIRNSLRNFIRANREESDDAAVKDARTAIEQLTKEKQEREAERAQTDQAKQEQQARYRQITSEAQKQKDVVHVAERTMYEQRTKLHDVSGKIDRLNDTIHELERRSEAMNQDIAMIGRLVGRAVFEYKDHTITADDGGDVSPDDVVAEEREHQEERKREIDRLMMRIEDNTVENTDEIVREYDELLEKDQFLERELADLEASASSLEELINELETTLEQEFTAGLQKINKEFQKLFSHMFSGGTAKLTRKNVSAEDEEENESSGGKEGVELYVNPPKKKIKGLQMLSGGERSLVSIALLFAMSYINPPPFIILDETDAALDEANARKYGDLIEELSERSQLILITHNRETMSRAGVLYGVTMGGVGASTVLSVAFEEAAESVVSS